MVLTQLLIHLSSSTHSATYTNLHTKQEQFRHCSKACGGEEKRQCPIWSKLSLAPVPPDLTGLTESHWKCRKDKR
jgi:hypothetical protein